MDSTSELPVAVIGAGPIGLAAAAHLLEQGLDPVILESGPTPAAAITQWRHIRLFSPWRFNLDAAAVRLLEPTGWEAPRLTALPYGGELIDDYLAPLAAHPAVADRLHTGARVIAVTRAGLDKTHSRGREDAPFRLRVQHTNGIVTDHLAAAVIDASGTWNTPNPVGTGGLPAIGEETATDRITTPLPDALGAERDRFAGQRVLVIGSGHSAANTLINLATLARDEPGTRVLWAIRAGTAARVYGGGDADGLPARGQLGSRLRRLVEAGTIELTTGFHARRIDTTGDHLVLTAVDGRALEADAVVPATGFQPELDMLRELRLDLDPIVEAPTQLGPLIDPEFHSCGTVPPHGARHLAHPEHDFYIVGSKSYGRAPTFLLATGYEQVRSITAALAGDTAAAEEVQLVLPETGVCSAGAGTNCDTPTTQDTETEAGSCCGTQEPAFLGIPTGLVHGRAAAESKHAGEAG